MQSNRIINLFLYLLFLSIGLIIGAFLIDDSESRQRLLTIAIFIIGADASILVIQLIRGFGRGQSTVGPEVKNGSEVGFVVNTFHDLVKRLKEREEELEQLKASAEARASSIEMYNENILQSIPSGVISTDNDQKIRSINSAAVRILGLNPDDYLYKKFTEVFRPPLREIGKEIEPVVRRELQYQTDNGRDVWLGISSSWLRDTEGKKMGMIYIFTDLTEIKALQERAELKERLSQLGEISAGIAHELRNSMSVISGYAKILSKRVEGRDRSTVEAIIKEIHLIDSIISELLAFARPTVLNKEEIDLAELVNDSISSAIGNRSDIEIVTDIKGPLKINADGTLLRQALTNVIKNSAEAIEGSGKIEIRAGLNGNMVEISVSDTGSGIPDEIKGKIFLPFFTTKQGGTGLGLALVQKIVIAHGGSIEVMNNDDTGTTVRIVLPYT